MDRVQFADFLRKHRESLQPEDVGLPRGHRRRTEGLRREEVAALCGMSVDYYSRLEQRRGPQPSEQMIAAIARGLHLSLDERDYLFRLAGHNAPLRTLRSNHINPALMRIIDRLTDTPAQVMNSLGETLLQTPLAVALLGNETRFTGMARSTIFRWFTDPVERRIYLETEHQMHSRVLTANLRMAYAQEGSDSQAAAMVNYLLEQSSEFARLWSEHEVGITYTDLKSIVHPVLGVLQLNCQTVLDLDRAQGLLVFTATPGTESYDKLQVLARMQRTDEQYLSREDRHPAHQIVKAY